MLIERIALKRFLVFEDLEVRLGPGLNVILSPNEGGKSSLMKGITTGLYSSASSGRKEIKELRRWGSDCMFRVEMEMLLGNEKLRLVRDFEAGEQALYRADETEPFARGRSVDGFLNGSLPLPDENLFLRVCGVRQEQLRVSDGKRPIGEKLEEILGGGWGEATPAGVKKALEDHRGWILRGIDHPAKPENWGPLKRGMSELAGLETRIGEAELAGGKREETLRRISIAEGEYAELDDRRGILGEMMEKARTHRELAGKEVEAAARADEARKRKERLDELVKRRKRLLEDRRGFPGVLLESGGQRLDRLKEDLAGERKLELELNGAGKAARPFGNPPLFVTSLLLLLGGLVGGALVSKWFLILALSGALAAVAVLLRRVIARGGRASEGRGELARLREERLRWSGGRSAEESADLIRAFESVGRDLEDTGIRLEELSVGGEAEPGELLERFEREHGKAASAWMALKTDREELETFRLDAAGMLRMEREISRVEAELETLRGEITRLNGNLAGLPPGRAAELEERAAYVRGEIERIEKKVKVVDEILDALECARTDMAGFLKNKLPPLAGKFLSFITGGRYDTVLFDPVTLRVSTFPAKADISPSVNSRWIPGSVTPDSLSRGVADQIYMSVRLALVELLSGGEANPLFLDDPLVHFDPERKRKAAGLITEFARRNQVVLFTCDPSCADLGGKLIRLAG